VLLVQLKSADVSCGKATLRTSPLSGQAAISAQLRQSNLCLPLRGSVRRIGKSEQKCPIEEAAAFGMSRPCSQFLA
jgi:hypothetical protein